MLSQTFYFILLTHYYIIIYILRSSLICHKSFLIYSKLIPCFALYLEKMLSPCLNTFIFLSVKAAMKIQIRYVQIILLADIINPPKHLFVMYLCFNESDLSANLEDLLFV